MNSYTITVIAGGGQMPFVFRLRDEDDYDSRARQHQGRQYVFRDDDIVGPNIWTVSVDLDEKQFMVTRGPGDDPEIVLDPNQNDGLDFPATFINQNRDAAITISNAGNGRLDVEPLEIVNGNGRNNADQFSIRFENDREGFDVGVNCHL